jgi:protein-S-isoprenylcysteine O-methyltransferase Ste14
MSASRARVTQGKASLIGGIVVGIASMALWVAVTHEMGFDGPVTLGAGLLVSAVVAVWIRMADL